MKSSSKRPSWLILFNIMRLLISILSLKSVIIAIFLSIYNWNFKDIIKIVTSILGELGPRFKSGLLDSNNLIHSKVTKTSFLLTIRCCKRGLKGELWIFTLKYFVPTNSLYTVKVFFANPTTFKINNRVTFKIGHQNK